jgi:hypothetical protein
VRIIGECGLRLVFGILVVPVGIVVQMCSDPLRRRRSNAGSYWVACERSGRRDLKSLF